MKYDETYGRWVTHWGEMKGDRWQDIFAWCYETFGKPSFFNNSWSYHGGYIYFYKESCVTMYTLKWA